jgi:hypothetical protein
MMLTLIYVTLKAWRFVSVWTCRHSRQCSAACTAHSYLIHNIFSASWSSSTTNRVDNLWDNPCSLWPSSSPPRLLLNHKTALAGLSVDRLAVAHIFPRELRCSSVITIPQLVQTLLAMNGPPFHKDITLTLYPANVDNMATSYQC